MFDDALLEDEAVLAAHDAELRQLAGAGARIRIEAETVHTVEAPGALRPRGTIVVGPEARLIRAVLEPVCPMPLVAWPYPGLPGWVGPLDLVVVLSRSGTETGLVQTVAEAARRGSALLIAAPPTSVLAERGTSGSTVLVPTRTGDPLAAAVAAMAVLHTLGVGPVVRPDDVAEAADMVAELCSPHRDLAVNPAKDLALGVGDCLPLVWGGTALAARASRRIAEAFRRAGGRPALSADAGDLIPVISGAASRDPFADPFEEEGDQTRPVLVVLDDPDADAQARADRGRLLAEAATHEVRVCVVAGEEAGGSSVDRYVTLLQRGLFGAAYLRIGTTEH